jgi:GT2 family glycosyltransferase
MSSFLKNKNMLAPIVLFIYNRPDHTEKTLSALSENLLAEESSLYIYADGMKDNTTEEQKQMIKKTREVAKSKRWCKEISIIESDKNKGLAASIISGVTNTVNRYGKIIVLEDDMVTSKYFLQYMNDALCIYQNNKKIWHISGYSYPCNKKGFEETFFTRQMSCWGWGTWNDRWIYFKKNPDEILHIFNEEKRFAFNYGKNNFFFGQIEANISGKINTWAVFWYATIFTHNGFCLNPRDPFVKNIGMDGSGIHSGRTNIYDVVLADRYPINFETNVRELVKTRKSYKKYFQGKGKLQAYVNNIKNRFKSYGVIEGIKYYMIKYVILKLNQSDPPV